MTKSHDHDPELSIDRDALQWRNTEWRCPALTTAGASPAFERKRVFDRLLLVVGALLVAGGLFFISFAAYSVWLAYSNCLGGLSPVPEQGCTYVPYLVLYVWGYLSGIAQGIALEVAGLLILVARWRLLAHRRAQESLKSQ